MWKILQESPLFFIKMVCKNNQFDVLITDYLNIWICSLSSKNLLELLKKSNEGLEFENIDDFLNIGVDMLTNPDKLKKVNIERKERNLELLLTKSRGFLIKLRLSLDLSSNLCMFSEVIQPLLKTISDLHTSQMELRKELMKKDKEIEEYKSEGGEIALRHLKTVPYDDEVHMNRHSQYEENFGSLNIPDKLLQPVADQMPKTETSDDGNKGDIKTETKTERQDSIKTECDTTIKGEPLSQCDSVQSSTCDIKPKVEPMISPRKKQRKLNL